MRLVALAGAPSSWHASRPRRALRRHRRSGPSGSARSTRCSCAPRRRRPQRRLMGDVAAVLFAAVRGRRPLLGAALDRRRAPSSRPPRSSRSSRSWRLCRGRTLALIRAAAGAAFAFAACALQAASVSAWADRAVTPRLERPQRPVPSSTDVCCCWPGRHPGAMAVIRLAAAALGCSRSRAGRCCVAPNPPPAWASPSARSSCAARWCIPGTCCRRRPARSPRACIALRRQRSRPARWRWRCSCCPRRPATPRGRVGDLRRVGRPLLRLVPRSRPWCAPLEYRWSQDELT